MDARRLRRRLVATAAATGAVLSLIVTGPALADTGHPNGPTTGTPTTSADTPTGTPTGTPSDGSTGTPTGSPTATGSPTVTPTPTPSDTPSGTPTVLPSGGTLPPVLGPSAGPTRKAPPPAAAPDPGDGETPLSPATVAAQLSQAQALQAALLGSNAKLAAITARMAQLSTQSSAAMQALQSSQRAEQQAVATASYQNQRLSEVQAQAAGLQLQLGRFARSAYVTGGALAHLQAYIVALQGSNTDDPGNALFLIDSVGRSETAALEQAQTLQKVQRLVTDQATSAAQQATSARVQAQAANDQVQRALAAQRALLLPEQGAQAGRLSQAAFSQQQLARLGTADAIAARAELAAAAAGASTSSASCRAGVTKKSVLGYADGQIPLSALCPIWGAPGQLLRADAAAAFDRLSKAYAAQFGRPICVTDSYRSYSQQVALYAAKPNLAAKPGHEQPRLGRGGRPLRWHRVLRHGAAPVAVHPRAAVRLVPPAVGRADRFAARAVALGVQRLTASWSPPWLPTRSSTTTGRSSWPTAASRWTAWRTR